MATISDETKRQLLQLDKETLANRRAYKVGNEYYVSFNTAIEPRPPSRSFKPFWPEHCWISPHWFNDVHPFMAFTLKDHFWGGKIFGRLQGSFYSFNVRKMRGRWGLDEQTKRSWLILENTLTGIAEYFLARSGSLESRRPYLHPLNIDVFRPPIKWGYTTQHVDEKSARIRVMNSRNAFVPLMAYCTYAIATNIDLYPFNAADWVRVLVEDIRVNPAWADELAFSPMMSTRQVRVGVYADQQTLPQNLFRRLIAFNVPLWVRIQSQVPNPTDTIMYRLSMTDIAQTSARNSTPLLQVDTPAAHLSMAITKDAGRRTTLPTSRQRVGETFEQFFSRTLKIRESLLAKETKAQRDSRLARERNAMTFNPPGPTGARVFEWRTESGFLKRCYVPRNEVALVWDDYANSQKRYDSALNEWDLCRELDPNAVPEPIDDDDMYFDDNEVSPMPKAPVHQMSEDDLTSMYQPFVPGMGQVPTTVSFFPFDDTLFMRYGFHPDGSRIPQLEQIPITSRYNERRCLAVLAEEIDGSLTAEFLNKLWYFVWAYVEGKQMPPGLHDLAEGNLYALRTIRSRLYALELDRNGHCHITSTTPNNQFQVIVRSASFGVEILRLSKLSSLDDVALFFISRGTEFEWHANTQGASISVFQPLPEPRSGLGYRSQNYKTNYYDFCAYVERRNKLLKDRSIARAALMKGGIIWRLAVEGLTEIYGDVDFEKILSEELEVVSLTQEDLGVIVGLYNVWTGTPNVTSHNSWWPQMHQWEGSNADLGYWTRGNEKWFGARSGGIKGGQFDWRTGEQWRTALRLENRTKRLKMGNEHACTAFINMML